MAQLSWQRDPFAILLRAIPGVTTVLFALISLLPFHLPGFGAIAPSFALMAVYQWTIYRPDLLHLLTVFGVGLLLDLLNGTPYLGLSALVLLLARTAILAERRYLVQRSFALIWLGFCGAAFCVFAVEWAFVSLMQFMLLQPRPFIFQALVTAACYPIGSYVLALAHRTMPVPR